MGWVVYFIFIFINMVLSINRKNNKLIIGISLLVIFLFYTFNTYNVDLVNYEYHFNEYVDGTSFRKTIEILYQVLVYGISQITSDFLVYMIVTGLVIVILFVKIFKGLDIVANLHNVIWLLFAYPLMPFFTQYRSFVGGLIFCFFLIKYLKNNKILGYLIGVMIASLFHISYVAFAPFILYRKLEKERDDGKSPLGKMYMLYMAIVAISIVFCFVSPARLIKLFSQYILKYGGIRFAYMLSDINISIRWYAKFLYIAVLVAETFLTYIAYKSYIGVSTDFSKNHFVTVVYELNLYSAFFMPTIFLTMQAERFFRIIFLINCITWSLFMKEINYKKKINFLLCEIIMVISLFFFFVYKSTEMFNGAFLPFFNDNLLWGHSSL